MSTSTDNFQGSWFRAIKHASTAWIDLTRLYHWSKTRIEDIQKSWPEYTLSWAKTQIMRIFNADPDIVGVIASQFGGGTSDEQKAEGMKVIERCGISETMRAMTSVPRKEFYRITQKAASFKGPDDLRVEVDKIASEVSQAARKLGQTSRSRPRANTCQECTRLRAENEKLRSRVRELEEKLSRIKAQFSALVA